MTDLMPKTVLLPKYWSWQPKEEESLYIVVPSQMVLWLSDYKKTTRELPSELLHRIICIIQRWPSDEQEGFFGYEVFKSNPSLIAKFLAYFGHCDIPEHPLVNILLKLIINADPNENDIAHVDPSTSLRLLPMPGFSHVGCPMDFVKKEAWFAGFNDLLFSAIEHECWEAVLNLFMTPKVTVHLKYDDEITSPEYQRLMISLSNKSLHFAINLVRGLLTLIRTGSSGVLNLCPDALPVLNLVLNKRYEETLSDPEENALIVSLLTSHECLNCLNPVIKNQIAPIEDRNKLLTLHAGASECIKSGIKILTASGVFKRKNLSKIVVDYINSSIVHFAACLKIQPRETFQQTDFFQMLCKIIVGRLINQGVMDFLKEHCLENRLALEDQDLTFILGMAIIADDMDSVLILMDTFPVQCFMYHDETESLRNKPPSKKSGAIGKGLSLAPSLSFINAIELSKLFARTSITKHLQFSLK